MRMSAYPRAFSFYPNWLKPVLVSLGAMFLVTALFLMMLIWKSAPSSAAGMSAGQALAAPIAPHPAPASAPAQPAVATQAKSEVPAAAAPHAAVTVHKSAKHR